MELPTELQTATVEILSIVLKNLSLHTLTALSIESIQRKHSAERLLVWPLQWTTRHLELLGCTFVEHAPASYTTDLPPLVPSNNDNTVESLVSNLTQSAGFLSSREHALGGIFSTTLTEMVDDIDFHYGSKFKTLQCTMFYSLRVPAAACLWVDEALIRSWRMRSLSQGLSFDKRFAKIAPERDPYIAGLLIALAQYKSRNPNKKQCQADHLHAHVLMSHAEDVPYMTLYSAPVPTALLDKLSHPAKSVPVPSEFCIHASKIHFQPAWTFRERVLQMMYPQGLEPVLKSDWHEWQIDRYVAIKW
ncbi:hypothetical protein K470DRAFT_296997 [Piedraia hortae CBS 480.64]|uniref:Uncharacterized protein n=1 Tax=Piedraia hortae CBS 480.64 TaxID=1314780 RepID=A0A6A7BRQ7_9PEZI|nr:hypothetical protein K470DRAFT_296997 [Piedraia hortae CBS 480.64]